MHVIKTWIFHWTESFLMETYKTYFGRPLKCFLIVELIPRPARSCEDPPLYLRLKMGKPLNKKIPHSTPLMSYGKKKMRPEYWFSVPKNRVDELYKFIQAWVPQLYGELDEEKASLCFSVMLFRYYWQQVGVAFKLSIYH